MTRHVLRSGAPWFGCCCPAASAEWCHWCDSPAGHRMCEGLSRSLAHRCATLSFTAACMQGNCTEPPADSTLRTLRAAHLRAGQCVLTVRGNFLALSKSTAPIWLHQLYVQMQPALSGSRTANSGYMIQISVTNLYMTRVTLVGDGKQSSGIQSAYAFKSAQTVARQVYAHGAGCVHHHAKLALQTVHACYAKLMSQRKSPFAGTLGCAVSKSECRRCSSVRLFTAPCQQPVDVRMRVRHFAHLQAEV